MSLVERVARGRWLGLAMAAACASPAPVGTIGPAPAEVHRPVVIGATASFPTLRTRVSDATATHDERKDAALALASMLMAAAHAGDDGAGAEAVETLHTLVSAAPEMARDEHVVAALGRALVTAGRLADARSLSRHAACPERYPHAPGAATALPQDHAGLYWREWELVHDAPLDVARSTAKRAPADRRPNGPASWDEEASYVPLYAGCLGGTARQWIVVATQHLETDGPAGPFRTNRAVEALRHAVAIGGPGTRQAQLALGFASMAREARLQGVQALSAYLASCERASATGSDTAGCEDSLRGRAAKEIGIALTYEDLVGPPDADPYIPRADWVEAIPDARRVRATLAFVQARLQDASLVAPSASWFISVHVAAAQELDDLGQPAMALAVLDAARATTPSHRELPRWLEKTAALHRRVALFQRPPRGEPHHKHALDVWTDLLDVTKPGGAWATTWSSDREAMAEADGVRARAPREMADLRRDLHVTRALGLAREKPNRASMPALRQAFADARVALAAAVAAGSVDGSVATARELAFEELAARAVGGDEISDDEWIDASAAQGSPSADERREQALFRVRIADAWVEHEEQRFRATHGAKGVKPRAPHVPGARVPATERSEPLPRSVEESITARVADAEVSLAAGLRDRAAAGLAAAAARRIAWGDLRGATSLLDRAMATSCRDKGGFALFLLRVDVARAQADRAAWQALARQLEGDASCATTDDDKKVGRAALRGAPAGK